MVYIREAHAIDSVNPSGFKGIEDPVTLAERSEVCVRCIDDLNIPIPAVVDDLDDSVNRAYRAFPDRLYLVGRDGKLAYAGGAGPSGFRPDELEKAIEKELGRGRPGSLLAALDKDGDGKLSAAEIRGAAKALKELDRNGDGELTPDELGTVEPKPDRPTPQEQARDGMFDRLDANEDGKLSREELPVRMRSRFSRLDTDDDGFVSREELAATMGRGGR